MRKYLLYTHITLSGQPNGEEHTCLIVQWLIKYLSANNQGFNQNMSKICFMYFKKIYNMNNIMRKTSQQWYGWVYIAYTYSPRQMRLDGPCILCRTLEEPILTTCWIGLYKCFACCEEQNEMRSYHKIQEASWGLAGASAPLQAEQTGTSH